MDGKSKSYLFATRDDLLSRDRLEPLHRDVSHKYQHCKAAKQRFAMQLERIVKICYLCGHGRKEVNHISFRQIKISALFKSNV